MQFRVDSEIFIKIGAKKFSKKFSGNFSEKSSDFDENFKKTATSVRIIAISI